MGQCVSFSRNRSGNRLFLRRQPEFEKLEKLESVVEVKYNFLTTPLQTKTAVGAVAGTQEWTAGRGALQRNCNLLMAVMLGSGPGRDAPPPGRGKIILGEDIFS